MQRGLAPQAADRRVGRPRSGRAAPAFDGGDQRRFFAADEGSGAEADFDVEVEGRIADVVAQQAAAPRFAQCGGEPGDGHRILGADVDEALAGADGIGRDGHALDDAMRIAFHHAAIHEGAGVALVAVADHILHVARGLGHRAPLQAGGIAAAAAPAQAALGDAVNHAVGRHLGERRQQRLVAVAGDVVVDLFRIDVAGVLQHHPDLLVEVLVQVALQFGDRLAAQAGHDGLGVVGVHVVVEGLLGVDADQRAGGTGTHAAGAADQHFFARGLGGLDQRVAQLSGALAGAGQVHADVHFEIEFRVFLADAFRDLFELLDRHSTAHLSSCSSICSRVISPATSPSQAPPARGCRRPRSGRSSG